MNDLDTLKQIKNNKPVILSITNYVTMDFVANCLLAIGASPIMTTCEEELYDLVKICSAIYINIGTLNNKFISLINKTIILAKQYHKKIIFDPVGSGATIIRTITAKKLSRYADIIRGNASEILAIATQENNNMTHGVDSLHTTEKTITAAIMLAKKYNTIIIISGEVDIITNGKEVKKINNGSSLMTKITGMGCAMTAVIAAFNAINVNSFMASIHATQYFAICGENTANITQNPGTFKTHFIDQLYNNDLTNMTI